VAETTRLPERQADGRALVARPQAEIDEAVPWMDADSSSPNSATTFIKGGCGSGVASSDIPERDMNFQIASRGSQMSANGCDMRRMQRRYGVVHV
jgi:hypothetical protein